MPSVLSHRYQAQFSYSPPSSSSFGKNHICMSTPARFVMYILCCLQHVYKIQTVEALLKEKSLFSQFFLCRVRISAQGSFFGCWSGERHGIPPYYTPAPLQKGPTKKQSNHLKKLFVENSETYSKQGAKFQLFSQSFRIFKMSCGLMGENERRERKLEIYCYCNFHLCHLTFICCSKIQFTVSVADFFIKLPFWNWLCKTH